MAVSTRTLKTQECTALCNATIRVVRELDQLKMVLAFALRERNSTRCTAE